MYPVCSLTSYPGVAKACGGYGMTEAVLMAQLAQHNPIDRLTPPGKSRSADPQYPRRR